MEAVLAPRKYTDEPRARIRGTQAAVKVTPLASTYPEGPLYHTFNLSYLPSMQSSPNNASSPDHHGLQTHPDQDRLGLGYANP
jgi:hypothetical protein